MDISNKKVLCEFSGIIYPRKAAFVFGTGRHVSAPEFCPEMGLCEIDD